MSVSSGPTTSRLALALGALSRKELVSLGIMAAAVVLLHLCGWSVLVWVVAPQNFEVGGGSVFGIGLGVTAYVLGLRHAFDVDHISAIDNTTRTLMNSGQRPLSVGFWFSLGHSSVVFGLCALLAGGIRAVASQLGSDASVLHTVFPLVGAAVSGIFLWGIGVLNIVALAGITRAIRTVRSGNADFSDIEKQVSGGGLVSRVFPRAVRAVRRPWQMYVVGLLFGLGFDTATEVSLLVLAGGAAAFALPWYAVLVLPVLFAAGMTLLDSVDGCFMNAAYGWAFAHPARKVYYNLLVTSLSVVAALVVGTIQFASILDKTAGLTEGPLAELGRLDLAGAGYALAAAFAVTWALATGIWRLSGAGKRIAPLPEWPAPPEGTAERPD